jgi:hypothetical protein
MSLLHKAAAAAVALAPTACVVEPGLLAVNTQCRAVMSAADGCCNAVRQVQLTENPVASMDAFVLARTVLDALGPSQPVWLITYG